VKIYSVMIITCVASLLCLSAATPVTACTVTETADWTDSAGTHFKVYDEANMYLGYVTKHTAPQDEWSVWVNGEGESNAVFRNKQEAVDALCPRP